MECDAGPREAELLAMVAHCCPEVGLPKAV